MPQHVSFAPGETIAADGKGGVFFFDPYTGAAEGWVVPAAGVPGADYLTDQSFKVGGVSSDGSRVVYQCMYYPANAPVPCGRDPSVHQWYLFDTTSGARTRLANFTGQFVTISPDAKTLLGVTAGGLAVAPTDSPDKTEPVAMPAGADASLYADWSPNSERAVGSPERPVYRRPEPTS